MAQLDRVPHGAPAAQRAQEAAQALEVAGEVRGQLPERNVELVAEAARLVAQQHDRALDVAQPLVVRDEAVALHAKRVSSGVHAICT